MSPAHKMYKLTVVMRYLLNKCMDSDQTYTHKKTLFGGDLELIRLDQGHRPIENVEFSISDAISP